MFFSPSRRSFTIALATASVVGTGLSADPASAAPVSGGVSVQDSVDGTAQGPEAIGAPLAERGIAEVAAAIDAAAQGSAGYAFRISQGGELVAGGAGGQGGQTLTVDRRVEVQLPGLQALLPAATKGAAARRGLSRFNRTVLAPIGVSPARCLGTCSPSRGLQLSATDLVRLAPSLPSGVGRSKGGWTTAAGQSDDGQATWQSGDGRLAGGREVHACVASAASLQLSIIFSAPIPGDPSPCRILLDAANGTSTAS